MAKGSRSRPVGPGTLEGSTAAKRQAVVLLEVLSGAKGPQEGSASLGISLNRYYQLETRGLQGMIRALEPRPRGKQQTAEQKLALAEADRSRLQREVSRYQALLRAAQRSVGLKPPPGRKLGSKGTETSKRRRRTRTVRATKAIAALSQPQPDAVPAAEAEAGQ